MKSNWLRGLMVFVSGMLVCAILGQLALLLYPYFAGTAAATHRPVSLITLSNLIVSAAAFGICMRLGTRFRRQDKDGETTPWFFAAMFFSGAALCAAVGWFAFLWASEIAHFIHLTLRA